MKDNPLDKLESFDQSIRLDSIRCDRIASGELRCLNGEDGLCGMTSNPSIFEKAIRKNDVNATHKALSQRDVQNAADPSRIQYEKPEGVTDRRVWAAQK